MPRPKQLARYDTIWLVAIVMAWLAVDIVFVCYPDRNSLRRAGGVAVEFVFATKVGLFYSQFLLLSWAIGLLGKHWLQTMVVVGGISSVAIAGISTLTTSWDNLSVAVVLDQISTGLVVPLIIFVAGLPSIAMRVLRGWSLRRGFHVPLTRQQFSLYELFTLATVVAALLAVAKTRQGIMNVTDGTTESLRVLLFAVAAATLNIAVILPTLWAVLRPQSFQRALVRFAILGTGTFIILFSVSISEFAPISPLFIMGAGAGSTLAILPTLFGMRYLGFTIVAYVPSEGGSSHSNDDFNREHSGEESTPSH